MFSGFKLYSRWVPLNDRWDRKNSISVIVVAAIATIAGKWFPYYRYDRCDRWTFFLSDRGDQMETRLKLRVHLTVVG